MNPQKAFIAKPSKNTGQREATPGDTPHAGQTP